MVMGKKGFVPVLCSGSTPERCLNPLLYVNFFFLFLLLFKKKHV